MRARARAHRPGATLGLTMGLLLAGAAAIGQESGVSIQVFNRSFEAIEVRILDGVCGTLLFEGQIFNESAVQLAACPNADGEATLTVERRGGGTETYPGLLEGSRVEIETDEE